MFPRRQFLTASASACLMAASGCAGRLPKLTVGCKSTTEQLILGEILAQHLTAKYGAARVLRRPGLLSTRLAHDALLSGEVDVYPEYSGTALIALHRLEPQGSKEDIRAVIMETYRLQSQCEWIGPLGFESPVALVASTSEAGKEPYKTLSEASDRTEGWRLYVSADFQERADGLPLLMRNYHLRLSTAMRIAEPPQLFSALERGQANLIAVSANDPALVSGRLRALEDDKHAFPPYEAGWAVRSATLERFPDLAPALRAFTGRISQQKIRELIRQVEVDHRSAESVASEFLKGAQL